MANPPKIKLAADPAQSTSIVQFTSLSEMGIERFNEISHYSLRQDGDRQDVLKVYYKRAKGSLLPYSRKYKFGRAVKSVLTDSGTGHMADVFEISPFLLKAVKELDQIVNEKRTHASNKAQLLNELRQLENVVEDKIAALRTQISNM